MTTETATRVPFQFPDSYVRSAAQGMLDSLDHYGHSCPPVGDGRVSTPAWFANRLGKILNSRPGDVLPGDGYWWWGDRFAAYAKVLLADLDATVSA